MKTLKIRLKIKHGVLVLILLTLIATFLPTYSDWAESRRQHQIQETKQQQRLVFGEPLEDVLKELKKADEPPAVVILYTGGTKSHLEPCGCYQEQSGGLPRRAYVVEQVRQQGFPTLLIDAGDIFDGTDPIDVQRCQINLKAMSLMEYDVLALSQNDLSYNDAYLIEHKQHATFPFLVQNRAVPQPFIVKQVGDLSVVFVSTGENGSEHVPTADIRIALGTSANVDWHGVDVVIRPDETETTKSEVGPLYLGSKLEGKTLGFLALWIGTDGELTRHHATQIALTGDVEESEPVRRLLTDFYREVSQSAEQKPLFASQFLEQQEENGYVSATACQSCHHQEYLQWSATRHAFAFETLLKKERYFDPSCVSCHTTGFAYPTGFEIGDSTSTLKDVQCETCHGPGKQHVENPRKTNIRGGDDTTLCLTCHDTKHSPGFADVVALHMQDVDHSREPMNIEELLTSRMRQMGKPTLELFVMSYCPFGIQAEEKLFPIVKKLGDKIDFKLQFIADEKEELTSQDSTPFISLHGYPEVAENIRQLLIAQEYPERYLDYILCRGKKLNENWETCARKFNINVEKIQALFDTTESEQHFRKNIKRAAELGIKASPTILVDNHEFQVNHLLRTFDASCQ